MKSKYKHVSHVVRGVHKNTEHWQATISLPNGKTWNKHCKTERGAAIAADTKLLEMGRESVNILKPKKK